MSGVLPRRPRPLVLFAAITVIMTACGGGVVSEGVATLDSTVLSSDLGPTSSTDPPTAEGAALAFAQCMRDNGAEDFEDPGGEGQDKAGFKSGADTEDSDLDNAYRLCKALLEGVTGAKDTTDDVAGEDQLYELAVCMRDNGFDMPDPNAAGDAYAQLDKDDPKFRAAFGACSHVFGSAETKDTAIDR